MRGRKPAPSALRKDGAHRIEPVPPSALPRCPAHLSEVAHKEWRRLARPLNDMGVLSTIDRAALAAYCQAYGRWVEAEQKLKEGPMLLKTPSGYAQQSPWLSISNKQLELMGRFMTELGLTPSSRTRVTAFGDKAADQVTQITWKIVYEDKDGNEVERTYPNRDKAAMDAQTLDEPKVYELDTRL